MVVAAFELIVPAVLSDYVKTTNKVNCDEPFRFCSNNRPDNEPGNCERNGGYPDNLNYDKSSSADYSQYRGAMALKPCFNKEMEDMGFEGDDGFRTIDVFTTNNFRVKPNVEYGKWNTISGGYGGYGRYKRQNFRDNHLNEQNAISVIFEEPGARMELINYLE